MTKYFLFPVLTFLTIGLMLGRQNATMAASAKVGASVIETLETEAHVFVVLALTEPAATRSTPVDLTALQHQVATSQADVLAAVSADDFILTHQFAAVPALSGWITARGVQQLADHPNIRRIDRDEGGSGSLEDTIPLLNIDSWHAQSLTGEGVIVAVLDSGYDSDHPDLADDLAGEACFLNDDASINGIGGCPNGSDRQLGAGSAEDDQSHGTFVSSIITSNGTDSSIGVAPDTGIAAIKVLDNQNRFYTFSEIAAALDYIITSRPDVKVINASLGTNAHFSGACDNQTSWTMAGASAVNTLRSNGVIMFASSGNDSSMNSMQAPACIENVVSVGATDKTDNIAGYSNRDATLDIYAPGSNIIASSMGGGTRSGFGTSFASPHAAGCAALLVANNDAITPDAIEAYLKASSVIITDPASNLSAPRINCPYVIAAAVSLSNATAYPVAPVALFSVGLLILLVTTQLFIRP